MGMEWGGVGKGGGGCGVSSEVAILLEGGVPRFVWVDAKWIGVGRLVEVHVFVENVVLL